METNPEILEKHYKNYRKRIAYEDNVLQAMKESNEGVIEEFVNDLEEIKKMCDGNVTKENNIWHKANQAIKKWQNN